MSDSFQPIAVTVTADAEQFDSTLTRVQKSISQFKNGLGQIGGAAGGLLSSVPLVGGAIGAGIAGFASLKAIESTYKETSAEIIANNREAQKLGITYKELIGIQLGSKSASEAMILGLTRYNKELGSAGRGNEESIKKLKLAGLGDAIGKKPADAIKLLFDRMHGIHDVSDLTATAMQVMGRGAADLVPVFQKMGSTELMKMIQHGEEIGLGISQEDINSILQARAAMFDLENSIKALKVQGTIKLAPIIQGMAETATSDSPITNFFKEAAAGLATGFASLPGIGTKSGFMGRARTLAPTMGEFFGVRQRAAPTSPEELADREAKERETELSMAVDKLSDKMRMERETVRMSAREKEAYALKTRGATDAQLAFLLAQAKQTDQEIATQSLKEYNITLQDTIDIFDKFGVTARRFQEARKGANPAEINRMIGLEQQHAEQQRIKSIQEGFADPADTFRKGLKELNEANIRPPFLMEIRNRRVAQLIQGLFASQNPFVNPGLAEQGSAEAGSFTNAIRNLQSNPAFAPTKDDVKDLLAQIDANTKRFVDGLKDVIDAINNNQIGIAPLNP